MKKCETENKVSFGSTLTKATNNFSLKKFGSDSDSVDKRRPSIFLRKRAKFAICLNEQTYSPIMTDCTVSNSCNKIEKIELLYLFHLCNKSASSFIFVRSKTGEKSNLQLL